MSIPSCKFPETVVFADKTSGANYYSIYNHGGDYKRIYDIRSMIHIDMSDFDENTMISAATGKKVDIAEAENGVKLFISIYNLNDAIFISYGFRKDLNVAWKGNISGGPYFTIAASKYFGIKVSCMTLYPQVPAVGGVTDAQYIAFMVLIPVQQGDALQSFTQVSDMGSYQLTYVAGQPTDLDTGTALFGPDGTGIGREEYIFVYSYTDSGIAQLVTDINQVSPGDPVSADDIIKIKNPEDPSQEENPSGPGGGDGSGGGTVTPGVDPYDPGSDPVDFPPLPLNGPYASGAVKIFVVNNAVLTNLFQVLWDTSVFDVTTWQKLLEAPLDSLIGLQCIPIAPTAAETATEIVMGNFETGVSASLVTKQYYTIDCGSIKVNPYWGSALDYSPYTKFQIYLPFIGIKDIQIDDAMNLTIHVKYNYDILSGNLVANVKCGKSVLYKFNGNVKQSIPISSYTNTQLESALRTIPIAAGTAMGAGATGAMVGAALNVAMSKTTVQRTGDLSGSTGLLDDFVPYIIIHRPMQSLAKNFKTFKGYPSNITATLSSLTGYTEVEYIHLTGISGATDEELNEIETLLKNGVIL